MKEDFSDAMGIANVTDINITTYTITGLLEGTRYYFKIKVIDNAGNEAFSEQVGSTTLEKRERKEFPRLLIGVVVIIIAIVAIAFVIITRKLKND